MSCKIAVVGEAWGEAEQKTGLPFMGAAGQELTRMLADAGIVRSECFLTNVFNLRPVPTNDIDNLCVSKKECGHDLPPLRQGKYIHSRYLGELDRLKRELTDCNPCVVLALGATASWALLGLGGISRIRGTVARSHWGFKVLPTYHPAAVLRQWDLRPVTVLDMAKALRESASPDFSRPVRYIHIEPTIEDLYDFESRYIRGSRALGIDIETAAGQITCLSFASSTDRVIVVPFVDYRRSNRSYWDTHSREVSAWKWVRKILASPIPKVFQNGLYDVNYLWRFGLPTLNFEHDTMLLHHALLPECEKGLGFLGSVYTNEPSWKDMRKDVIVKKD